MSQASQLCIYFVLPYEDKEAQCSKDMYDAFTCVKQYKGKPIWVLPSFCLSHTPHNSDVFVFDEFKGEAFEKLKKDSSKIIGAKCMLTCMSAGDTIPPGTSPIFTEGMRGLIVCCTGFDTETKKILQEKIEYMGGVCHSTLRSIITHVVAHNNISKKAVVAYKTNKPVMTKDWVDAVWKRSLEANVRGSDKEFQKYYSPIFHNLKITTSGISKRKKDNIKTLITDHGGQFTGALEMNSTDILVIDTPEGDKYRAAKEWKVICVKANWVTQCVKLGKIVPLEDYSLEETIVKASTPTKGNVNFTGNFSMVSVIEKEERNFTHLEETADVTSSQSKVVKIDSSRQQNQTNAVIIDQIAQTASEAGQFLDGCNIFLSGFSQGLSEKLKKILNFGGATRFDELTPSVTHIVVANYDVETFQGSAAHVLPLKWLSDSVALRRPAPIEQYVAADVNTSKAAPPSPLSKQGAALLSRPEPRRLNMDQDEAPVDLLPAEDDLIHRYNLSQQGEPIAERRVENFTPNPPSFTSSRSDMTQTNTELFQGRKFFLSKDLSEDELEGCENLIVRAGGTVVSKKFSGVPDYAVVPIAGAYLSEVTALEVVNLLFVKECVLEAQIVPIQYYHQTLTWLRGTTPLRGCVISVSKYVGSERDFIETIIETLGAVVQAILAKKQKNEILKTTHLICAEPSGMKYDGAVRWGLPVVHHNWLIKCAELGKRVSEEPYLMSEQKKSMSVVNKTGIENSSKEPNEAMPAGLSSSRLLKTDNVVELQIADSSSNRTLNKPKSPESYINSKVNTIENEKVSARSIVLNHSTERTLTPEVPKKNTLELSRTKTPLRPGDSQDSSHSQITLPTPVASKAPLFEAVGSPLNKALERLKHQSTPKGSPSQDMEQTLTPTSPYGACFGNDNPSPGTRKRLLKWMNTGAKLPLDPPTKRPTPRTPDTPVSELLNRQLRLMMRRPEDQPPDDSPEAPPAKRLNLSQTNYVNNDVITGLQKMKEIEASYYKTSVSVPSSAPVSEEPKLVIVTESQPHTEIGWDDPCERELALACLEKAADQIKEQPPKIFMFSGLSESVESAKELVEASGGKVSSLGHYDRTATHLIAATNMTRAEKLMGSIAAGLWVLHPSYLEQLAIVKDVCALKEEDFEWGNPRLTMPLDALSKNVRECVISAYHWRCDVQLHKKPPPFAGMKVILKISPSKSEVFKRLIEAGGGDIKTIDTISAEEQVFCICEMTAPPKSEMENLAKRGICCVTTLFISDVILRKATAVEDNMVAGFSEIWKQWQI